MSVSYDGGLGGWHWQFIIEDDSGFGLVSAARTQKFETCKFETPC